MFACFFWPHVPLKAYKFNGASIDYSKTKTIQIAEFPVRSSYVWGPMGPLFNNRLKDQFADHTKLIQVKRNGDLKIEGEITQYTQRNKSVTSDGRSAQTELAMTVNVRFTNTKNHAEDFEKQFTSTASYETTKSLKCRSRRTRYTDDKRLSGPDFQCNSSKLVSKYGY